MQFNDDLSFVQERIFGPFGFKYTEAKNEAESLEYKACSFSVEGRLFKYRLAKITPTKIGQFVTFWKRSHEGPIRPYDSSDQIDFLFVAVKIKDRFGLFIFPKEALIKHGLVSNKGIGGKRAIRVYPPWDKTTSKQAEKTQTWQLGFFLDVPINKSVDITRCKELLSLKASELKSLSSTALPELF